MPQPYIPPVQADHSPTDVGTWWWWVIIAACVVLLMIVSVLHDLAEK